MIFSICQVFYVIFVFYPITKEIEKHPKNCPFDEKDFYLAQSAVICVSICGHCLIFMLSRMPAKRIRHLRSPEAGDFLFAIGASVLFYSILQNSEVDPSHQSLPALRAVGGVPLMPRDVPNIDVFYTHLFSNVPRLLEGLYRRGGKFCIL